MERLQHAESSIPGVRVERFREVSPEDLVEFRKEAILFVAERELTPEEIQRLNKKTYSPMVEKEFDYGLRMRRFNFPFGSFLEEWRDDKNLYRVTFDRLRKRVRTTRYSTP